MQPLIALLGRKDTPTDGLEDYCTFLGEALRQRGIDLKRVRVDWVERGWARGLLQLWRESAQWRGRWVLLQFTSLAWSRRGFPFAALAVIVIVRSRGARAGVVYHEPGAFEGARWIDRVRKICQQWVLRQLYNVAEKAIFADPLERIPWLPANSAKAVSIPIGGNLPETAPRLEGVGARNGNPKIVAVYCLSDPPHRECELEDIRGAIEPLAANGSKLRLVFLGRGTSESKADIEKAFREVPVELLNLGILSAAEVSRRLAESDVMLCVRGRLFPRRGSAMAGIACGLPIVAYAGASEGTPIAEAGVELVPYRNVEALTSSLSHILENRDHWHELHVRSLRAQEKYFSWSAIAEQLVNALGVNGACDLRIVLYTHAWSPTVGGVQIITSALAHGLSDWCRTHPGETIEVTLVTQTPAGEMNDSAVPFRVVRQPSNRQLVSLIRSADIVHIANPALIPLALGWLFRKPMVVEHSGYQAVCPNGLLLFEPDRTVCPGHYLAARYGKCIQCNAGEMGWPGSLRSLLFTFPRRWLARRASVNIAPTNHIGRRVALPETRVISHGVPKYSTVDGSPSPPDDAGTPYFAYVGRLVTEKGLPVLLRACSMLSGKGYSFHLKIVGDGTERPHLERLTAELGLGSQIEFLGSVSVERIPQLLRGATAVIMPSIWEDVAPLVAYEQLMHGHLVIASDIGGLGEIVDDVGLKFPPGDAEALAACMRRVLEEPNLVKDLRGRAQRRAQEAFTLEHMVANHLAVFRELAGMSVRQSQGN